MINAALALRDLGFHVFPLRPGSKKPPMIKDFEGRASRARPVLERWWGTWPEANVGIATGVFQDGLAALLVVDVDKHDADGEQTKDLLELEGFVLPPTLTQRTPTGGRHLIYWTPEAVPQGGAHVLGPGLDVRSRGGYIAGAGSRTAAGEYTADLSVEIAQAPTWLVERLIAAAGPAPLPAAPPSASIDLDAARTRAAEYLRRATPAVQGAGGDDTTLRVAMALKDFLPDPAACLDAMAEHYNPRCSPPWSFEELQEKVANAFKYGKSSPGAAAPESEFAGIAPAAPTAPVDQPDPGDPIEKLNRQYAFVVQGGSGHVLFETTDVNGNACVEHLQMKTFHDKLKPLTIRYGKDEEQLSEVWMSSPRRRAYDGVVFAPGRSVDGRFYNLWRGFAVEPSANGTAEARAALDAWILHVELNVCGGNAALARWLTGYFAQMLQRPAEKSLTALVFEGPKGTGKNAAIERVGALLGDHFGVTEDQRYLTGSFNSHLEHKLFFLFDEVAWGGDKKAQAQLQGLITAPERLVERKYVEPYKVRNFCRFAVLSNEPWIVPASPDERRYAIFRVTAALAARNGWNLRTEDGTARQRGFFHQMRVGMERGGYALLLRYLLDFDLTGIDVNAAPQTEGLRDQKLASLEPVHQFWLDCLAEGRVPGADFEDWPGEIPRAAFRSGLRQYAKDRQIYSRLPDERIIGRQLKLACPSIGTTRPREDGARVRVYTLPALDVARAEWDRFIGHPGEWS